MRVRNEERVVFVEKEKKLKSCRKNEKMKMMKRINRKKRNGR